MSFAARVAAMSEGEFRANYHEVLAPFAAPEATAADRHWAETAAFASSSAVYRSAKGLWEAARRGETEEHFRALTVPTTVVVSPQTRDQWSGLVEAEGRGVHVRVVESPSRAQFFDRPQEFYEAVAEAAEAAASPK
jgi:hypothetical protein